MMLPKLNQEYGAELIDQRCKRCEGPLLKVRAVVIHVVSNQSGFAPNLRIVEGTHPPVLY